MSDLPPPTKKQKIRGTGILEDEVNELDSSGRTAVWRMAAENDVRKLNLLIAAGADVNMSSTPPLLEASIKGNHRCVELLVKAGANVNINNVKGMTPLHLACQNGCAACVELLLQSGADVNKIDINEDTPLIYACKSEPGCDRIAWKFWDLLTVAKPLPPKLSSSCLVPLIAHMKKFNKINGSSGCRTVCSKYTGYSTCVELLIAGGANVNHCNNAGDTALHIACDRSSIDCITHLLNAGANLNVLNKKDEFPLDKGPIYFMCANMNAFLAAGLDVKMTNGLGRSILYRLCGPGYEGINRDNATRDFILAGADVNMTDLGGHSPLHYACINNRPSCVALLLQLGADIHKPDMNGMTPLLMAAKYDRDSKIVKLLVEAGAEVTVVSSDTGTTPLHEVCSHARSESIRLLLAAGAKVNVTDLDGVTPFHRACFSCDFKESMLCIELLMSAGADIHAVDLCGRTPLHEACSMGGVECITVLIKAEVDINKADISGYTPLHYAIDGGSIKELLEAGAVVNVQDEKGQTPLLQACKQRNITFVEQLLDAGADLKCDNKGYSPLEEASRYRDLSCAQLLIERGADINRVNADGRTLLFTAIVDDHEGLVKLLIESGVDINQAVNFETPIMRAMRNRKYGYLAYLMRNGADLVQGCGEVTGLLLLKLGLPFKSPLFFPDEQSSDEDGNIDDSDGESDGDISDNSDVSDVSVTAVS